MAANRWLGFWIETLGNTIVLGASLFALTSETISPGLAGLAITYALNVTDTFNWLLRVTGDLETNSVSYERILEYTDLESEADWNVSEVDDSLGQSWPGKGEIEFKDYQTKYRVDLDLVLKDLTFQVKSGEKIGICGGTGAGQYQPAFLLEDFEAGDMGGAGLLSQGQAVSNVLGVNHK